MIGRARIIWWQLSFFESSSHGIEKRIGQHTSLIDQGTINSIINHVLKFTRISVESDLPRRRQCFFLDYFAAPIDAERPQTLLLVVLHGFRNSLLLLILEIGFRHGDDVFLIELSSRHVDLDTDSCPTGRTKRCVDAKGGSANTKG